MKNKDFLKENKIIAVIKANNFTETIDFAFASIEGGIKLIEVIINSQDSYKVIEEVAKVDEICVGAGTVMDILTVENSYNCGAKFIVSPHTDKKIISLTKSKKLVSVAGAFTSSEIVNTISMGADFAKVFPASLGGPNYIKAIKDPLGFVDILVTGGINSGNISEYINAGASLVGVSSALLGSDKEIDKKIIKANAKSLVESLR